MNKIVTLVFKALFKWAHKKMRVENLGLLVTVWQGLVCTCIDSQ